MAQTKLYNPPVHNKRQNSLIAFSFALEPKTGTILTNTTYRKLINKKERKKERPTKQERKKSKKQTRKKK